MVKSTRIILKASYKCLKELVMTLLLLTILLPFVVLKHSVVALIEIFREMANEVKNVIWDARE